MVTEFFIIVISKIQTIYNVQNEGWKVKLYTFIAFML